MQASCMHPLPCPLQPTLTFFLGLRSSRTSWRLFLVDTFEALEVKAVLASPVVAADSTYLSRATFQTVQAITHGQLEDTDETYSTKSHSPAELPFFLKWKTHNYSTPRYCNCTVRRYLAVPRHRHTVRRYPTVPRNGTHRPGHP